jgi:FkbM family methyltransferase
MKSLLADVLGHLREVHAINRADLPDDLKKRIRKTYVELAVLKRTDPSRKVARVVGLPMHYCTESNLSYLFREIFVRQEYRFECDTEAPYIVDCGSNIGMSLLYFKMIFPGAEILAFEPDRAAFDCLERNMRENRIDGVEMVNKALSDKVGKITLFHDSNEPGSLRASTVRDDIFRDRLDVDGVRLSDYLTREVDFLKIDIEGAEPAVIEDLARAGKLPLIKQMAIEYHHFVRDDADSLSPMLHVLEDAGLGYQLESRLTRPLKGRQYQDILVYAYRRGM